MSGSDEYVSDEEIKDVEPGDIDDIKLNTPTLDQQKEFYEKLSNLSTKELGKLFKNMAQNNSVNPNNNHYNSYSKESMNKYKLKQRIKMMENRRKSKAAIKTQMKKKQAKEKKIRDKITTAQNTKIQKEEEVINKKLDEQMEQFNQLQEKIDKENEKK